MYEHDNTLTITKEVIIVIIRGWISVYYSASYFRIHINFFPFIFKSDISRENHNFSTQQESLFSSIYRQFSKKYLFFVNKYDSHITFFSKCSVHLLLWYIANTIIRRHEEFVELHTYIPEFFYSPHDKTSCVKAAILHDNLVVAGGFIIHVHSLFALRPALYFPVRCIVQYKLKDLLRVFAPGIALSTATMQRANSQLPRRLRKSICEFRATAKKRERERETSIRKNRFARICNRKYDRKVSILHELRKHMKRDIKPR